MRIVRLLPASLKSLCSFPKALRWSFLLTALLPLSAFAQLGGAIQFTAESYPVSEAEGTAVITVTRDSEWGMVAVDLLIADGTATNGVNFMAEATNTIVFSNFQTSVTLTIDITDDTATNSAVSADAALTLANPRVVEGENPLYAPELGTLVASTLQIVDNDKPLQFNFEKLFYEAIEGQGTTLTVLLAEPAGDQDQGVEVDFAVVSDTSLQTRAGSDHASGEDFEPLTGTLTFAAGEDAQTIDVTSILDDLVEFNEDFFVILSNPRGERAAEEAPPDGEGEPTEPGEPAPYELGPIATATVTLLFNGSTDHPQPAGAVDNAWNPDTAFNTLPGANNTVYAVAATADGKTVIGGEFTAVNSFTRGRIARLMTNGLVDVEFDPSGGANDFVSTIAVYTNGPLAGRVLLGGGFSAVNGIERNGIARLNEDGSTDLTFNPGLGANGPVYSIALQKDGTILAAGDFTSINGVPLNRVARLLPNGGVDLSFDPGLGANGPVYSVVSETAPAITYTDSITNGLVQMYSRTLDAGATSGFVTLQYNFFDATNDLVLLYEGMPIHMSGLIDHAVITTNATNSSMFETNYVPTTVGFPFSGNSSSFTLFINTLTNANSNWVYTVSIQPNIATGLFIGGDFTQVGTVDSGRVAKLNGDGTVNAAFAENLGLGADDIVYGLGRQTNGKLILGGSFLEVNSFASPGLARLNTDGSLDQTFSVGYGASDIVYSVHVDPNDRIYVGGGFTSFNATRRIHLARLLPNGPVDTSFLDSAYNQFAGFPHPDGSQPFGAVNSIATTTSGDVLVGGSFSLVGGGASRTDIRPRGNFAQLHGGETPGPGNVSFVQDLFGGNENGGLLNLLTVRTNGNLGGALVVYTTTEGGAIDGEDFEGVPGGTNIVWGLLPPPQSQGVDGLMVEGVPILDDETIEGDEDFQVDLVLPVGAFTLGGEFILPGLALGELTEATAIILENDVEPATVFFSEPEYDFNENDGSVSINVYRQGNASRSISVRYSGSPFDGPNPATVGDDYDSISGTLAFASGQTNRTFTVRLNDDEIVEPDESLILQLSSASSGVVLGTNSAARLNIIDNDYAPGRVSLSATNYTITEGGAAVVTVRRTGGNFGVLRVNYATVDDSATAPFDYTSRGGTLVWNDRDTAPQTITIPTNDDGLVEGDKQFSILLSNPNPSGGLGLRTNATVTILDNDFHGTFSFNAAEFLADENGTNVIVNVIRRDGSAETATVQYATTNQTAIAGEDYEAVSGTLTFGIGETSKSFLVPILDNQELDGEKTIGLILSSPQPAGASLGLLTNASIAIIDNEAFNIPAGSPETDFAIGSGANDAVHALALQPDGRILIGGDFTVVNRQVRTRLARLNGNGSLDTSFGANYEINGSVRDIALQSDGRAVIAGSFTSVDGLPANYLARISGGGIRDGTFNIGAGADNPVFAVETYENTNGVTKILIGGSFSRFNSVDRRGIARVNADGRTDLSFNPGSGVNGTVYAIAVQRDGKILVAGDFVSVDGEPRLNIARLHPNGSLDLSFDPGIGADGSIRALLVQYDDKIVVGGLFTTFSGVPRGYVARLNADGTLDASFDPGLGANGAVYALALQLDGKVVAAGEFTSFDGVRQNRIARLNHDGSLDPSINFGQGANGFVAALAIQPDRRILLGGGFTEFDGLPRNRVARVYGGSVSGVGEIEFAQADFLVLENATNALIRVRRSGGLLGTVSAEYRTQARTAEPNADYTDVSGMLVFGPGENEMEFTIPMVDDSLAEENEVVDLVLTNATGGATLIKQPIATLTIISDDSVIGFAEALYTVSESAAGGSAVIIVRREGELSFPASIGYASVGGGTAQAGTDYTPVSGTLNFAAGEDVRVFTVPIMDDGSVEENETVSLELLPLSPDQPAGRIRASLTILDDDFAPGILNLATAPSVSEGGGNVAVTVNRVSGRTGAVTVEYVTLDGTASSGQDYAARSGVLVFLEGETSKSFLVPVLQDENVEGTEFFIVQISNPTGGAALGSTAVGVEIVDDDFGPGSFDTTFNIGGGAAGPVYSMLLQPDSKILLAGGFTSFDGFSFSRLARLNPDGSPDAGFAVGAGLNDDAFSVALHNDGKIAVGGEFTAFGPIARRSVGRFLTNGLADVNFNLGAGENGPARSVAAQPDGKIIVGGEFTTPTRGILRLNQDGSLDVSFNPDGGPDGNVYRVRLQDNGRVLVGGEFNRFGNSAVRSLVRLLPNGLLDASFQIGSGVNGRVNAITIAPDGKILIGGDFTSVNGTGRGRVARLNADGSVDLSFVPASAPNGPVNDIAVFLDKVYIVGDFTQAGGTDRNRIARLNTDGSLDTEFDAGLGADGPVHAVSVQSNGQILIAGDFSSVNGFFSPGIARLNGDQGGQPDNVVIQSARAEAGSMVLSFTTQVGRAYLIEGSSDLENWQTIETRVASSTSSEFRELADQPHRFYRIRTQ